jgi:hypothetical protein
MTPSRETRNSAHDLPLTYYSVFGPVARLLQQLGDFLEVTGQIFVSSANDPEWSKSKAGTEHLDSRLPSDGERTA